MTKAIRHVDGDLAVEDVAVSGLAEDVGTPFYVYSQGAVVERARAFAAAVSDVDALIAYSVKANSNLGVLAAIGREGLGADIVSGGELFRVRKAGLSPDKVVFSGVGKTRDEIDAALAAGIFQINAESPGELDLIDAAARAAGATPRVAARVNPDIVAGGHAHISTGKSGDKFGVAIDDAAALFERAQGLDNIRLVGVAVHIGSQITELAPFEAAFERVAGLARDLRGAGHDIETLDFGGGLGVCYDGGAPPISLDGYAAAARRAASGLGVKLIFEPGRFIVAQAGALVARVLSTKLSGGKRILILDAAMNDLMRPALYGARHEIVPVRAGAGDPGADHQLYDIVGPVCETADAFARDHAMPALEDGDLVAILDSGAYGAVLSSAYNTRPPAPEVLVSGDRTAVVRERPSYEQMIAGERAPDWLV